MPADMTMLADHTARQLLDFSQKLDINLLDNVVNSMYYDVGSQVRLERGGPRVYHHISYLKKKKKTATLLLEDREFKS